MTNRINRLLLILIVLVAVPFWWLLIDTDRGSAPPKPVHIADLRKLAGIVPGPRPAALTCTVLGTRLGVGDFFAAGVGIKRRPLAIVAWTLPVPGGRPIMIDPAPPPADASLGEVGNFNRSKQSQLDAQAKTAGLILWTQARTSAQGPASYLRQARYLLGGKAGMVNLAANRAPIAGAAPASFTTAQAVAPGVVVISAASVSPGAQLIFVALADGREFLFTGNIAAISENWSQLRARSRLADEWDPPQNRYETYAWLRTIRQLYLEAPKMRVVPGHDYLWLTKQQAAGAIAQAGFDQAQTR